jgi:hypothetical protein
MKKKILLFACAAFFSVAFYACSNNAGNSTDNTAAAIKPDSSSARMDSIPVKQAAVVYTCRMHPEVISDKPGKCPKCGMELVKKDSTKH